VSIARTRLARNQNLLVVITGQTGTGKSLSALEFARLIDPKFTAAQIVFTVTEFLTMMEVLGPGRVIIFDEAGVDLDARRSSSKKNVFFSNILKTFRYLQIPTIFTLPNLMMLDKNARRLFHLWIKTREIDYKKEICWASYYIISADDEWNDTITRALPRVHDPVTHEKRKITRVGFHKPPPDLLAAYEAKKDTYVTEMLQDMRKSLADANEEKPRGKRTKGRDRDDDEREADQLPFLAGDMKPGPVDRYL
jgi:ABC-type dipeptide/oligopeptide/nickel transport system ATPase component